MLRLEVAQCSNSQAPSSSLPPGIVGKRSVISLVSTQDGRLRAHPFAAKDQLFPHPGFYASGLNSHFPCLEERLHHVTSTFPILGSNVQYLDVLLTPFLPAWDHLFLAQVFFQKYKGNFDIVPK